MFLVKWRGYKNPSWTYEKDVVEVSQQREMDYNIYCMSNATSNTGVKIS